MNFDPRDSHLPISLQYFRAQARKQDDKVEEIAKKMVAFQNLTSKFNAALGIEPQGFCAVAVPRDPESDARGR